jgi:2,4-dienoyl-CoA reductase-like NADH-dependent reductase (Old Yellow Enzyme family)
MCQYSAVDGIINAWHLVHLGSRAVGGAGLVLMEATAVEEHGRISPHCTGLWSDDHVEPLRQLTGFIRSMGAVAGIQIAHAGRKASTSPPWDGLKPLAVGQGGWQPVAPSPLPWTEEHNEPTELDAAGIGEVQKAFGAAARRAHEAGFQMLELHAAHGYLCHSFLSPITNKRTDEYGGDFDNRIRFVLETVKEIRREWPDRKPLSVRFSCTDWVDGGWTLEESIELATKLKWEGVDIIDCSSGGIMPGVKYPSGPSWQVPLAAEIRSQAGVPTMAVGLIVEPMQADAIIRNERVDMVLLGREMLRRPYWPIYAAQKLDKMKLLDLPQQYSWVIKKI